MVFWKSLTPQTQIQRTKRGPTTGSGGLPGRGLFLSAFALAALGGCGDQSESASDLTSVTTWSAADAAALSQLQARQSERSRYVVDGSVIQTAQALASSQAINARAFVTLQARAQAKEFQSLGMASLWLTPDERDALTASGKIRFVEPVRSVHLIRPISETSADDLRSAQEISWGLDRIDQPSLPLDGRYTPPQGGGKNVWAFVIDTGIDGAHGEFSDRMEEGFSAIDDRVGTFDCQGHGTHVAGTIAGSSYGVAPQARLIPVRVLDCTGSGTSEGVIAGMDFVLAQKKSNPNTPMVANMSLGGDADQALDAAVARLVRGGVFLAVAAGNEDQDACNVSPARAPEAVTTGATAADDNRAVFSNKGRCVDVYAPGARILSAKPNNGRAYLSGTSMASPHVAGVGALVLAASPRSTPAQVTARIIELARKGTVGGVAGKNPENRMLQAETRPANNEPIPEPTPTPTPVPGAPTKTFEGSLSQGQSNTHTWRVLDTPSGDVTVQASLQGPSGAEFSITLQRWNYDKRGWDEILTTTTPGAQDTLTWRGQREGGFRFLIKAARGNGAYTLSTTISRNR